VVKILENDAVHIRVVGFRNQVVRSDVQPVQRPLAERTADRFDGEVC
jgi:hypothetical protein